MANEKKGLSPIAWVAIGCGVLLLLGVIAITAGVGFLGFKAKQFGEEMSEKPVETAAKLYARINPEIEYVSSDEASRTMTFRNVETGEEITIDAEDIEDGTIRWTQGDEEMEISSQEGEDGGTVTVRKGDEVSTFGKTGAGAESLPDWVPVYPDATEVDVVFTSEGSDGTSGTYSLKTTADAKTVMDYYQQRLEDEGYEVRRQNLNFGGTGPQGLITGKRDRRTINLTMSAEDDGSAGMVQYSESPQ